MEEKKEEYDWYKENADRETFALTQEEIDFYYNKEWLKERFGDEKPF